ncbi:hypothetical protein KJ657_04630 [Patescibacteria group bacterium]|nr:hypothetical protein [Patescibacteria group bacterium]MBU1016340.1 hypothetical protein [Patescibacteria group bacterium]MBU1685043.1 hypothetical protein [Patescibacteria group bacterium]MBU1938851.1 hypothetical protein [Patescibacteria group bacterium]
MCFNSGNCRDTYYCEDSRALTNSVDCAFCESCELCYECVDCLNCYNSNFSQDCTNCEDIHFSYDLRRCRHCIGCVGLRDKEYCIFNQQKTEEEYEKALQTLDTSKPEIITLLDQRLEELKRKVPRMFVHQFDTQDCSGDYIYHSKNCYRCFDTRHSEDSGYIFQANLDKGTTDSWDCGPVPTGLELCYDVCLAHYSFNCRHLYWCGYLKDCQYTTNSFNSKNLFGCHYLDKKEDGYYILNQKVEEGFYRETTKKISEDLKSRGIYSIYDLLNKNPDEEPIFCPKTQRARQCVVCGEGFELVDAEVKFYDEMDIMYPVKCPECRNMQRTRLRNDRTMYKRKCDSCKSTLISTYPPDSPYIVYCLDCYWKHIG